MIFSILLKNILPWSKSLFFLNFLMCARNHFKCIFKRISALSFKFQMGSNLFQFVHWHALPAQHSSWKRLNLNKNLHPTIHLSVDLMKSDRIKELKLNHFCHIDLDLQLSLISVEDETRPRLQMVHSVHCVPREEIFSMKL